MNDDARFDTRAIHAGLPPEPHTGAVVQPIYHTSTFYQPTPGELLNDYEYTRAGNPNRTALQQQIAALEGARHGAVFSSGLAAEDCLIRAMALPGTVLVVGRDAYGGTLRLFRQVHQRWGVDVRVVDLADRTSVESALAGAHQHPPIVWVETPSNPWMIVHDLAMLSAAAQEAGAQLVVDNTFASPALQRPLELGADAVVHSTTKYLGGHSDIVGGAVVCNDDDLAEQLSFQQRAVGAVAGPMDCWLTSRGIKTLGVRMARHCDNAATVAKFLDGHPDVTAVYYPGLDSHPGHELAAAQMSDFGGMVSVELATETAARALATSTTVFCLAESLGGVESLICHPASMTHASLAGADEEVPGTLLRLSVGIEDVADLLADLEASLGR